MINSKFFGGLTAAVAFTGVIANAGVANALLRTYTDTVELQPTDITDALLSIQKFDGSLGTLQSVTVGFDAQIVGDAQVESLDAQAQTLVYTATGDLVLVESTNTLDNPLFVEEDISVSDIFKATAFDGMVDFGGTSGQHFEGLTAIFNGENIYEQQSELDFFTGAGNVEFLFTATTDAEVIGAANLASILSTKAGATVTVKYEYEDLETTPEPSSILGLGLFAGAGILSKKKLANKA